ncbi:MAG: hypothetical protein AAF928_11330 [Myxococcota bacterium]
MAKGFVRRDVLAGGAAAAVGGGCGRPPRLTARARAVAEVATVDGDPLSVLPDEALMVSHTRVDVALASGLGNLVGQLLRGLVPTSVASGLVHERDIRHLYSAAYAMQGADVIAVVQGTFDPVAIQAAASDPGEAAPLVRTPYGPFLMHTRGNVGFTVLTPFTLVAGTETALRRTLDRLRYPRPRTNEASSPAGSPWVRELIGPARQDAAFAVAGDVDRSGVIEAAAGRLPFVVGLQRVRVLGNFRPPGVNLVGTLRYADEDAARRGASGLSQARQLTYLASLFSNFGLGGQMPPLEVTTQGRDVAFATEVDTPTANTIMGLMVRALVA